MHWIAHFHLYKYFGVSEILIFMLSIFNQIVSFLASVSPSFCPRLWCFWVGGFEEIEFRFQAVK